LSTLGRISEGFAAGSIERCVKRTLTVRRIARLEKRPIAASEFINGLALEASKREVPLKTEQDTFNAFTEMISGLGDRRKLIEDLNNPDAADQGKKGGGKKK